MENINNSIGSKELKEALDIWVELTGIDPENKSFSGSMGDFASHYEITKMNEQLQEALELDDSNVMCYLLLDAVSKSYFSQRSFTVEELLDNEDFTYDYLEKVMKFKKLVNNKDIVDLGDEFIAKMREALTHYGALNEETEKLLSDRSSMAYLRRDALRSLEKLRVHQFLRGESDPVGTKPEYHEAVHQFWSVNGLIKEACAQPSGVTLNLIRDPMDTRTYFCFAIRNGGNLFVLSDVSVDAHPLQKYMSRRPERGFMERTARDWFPYDLLDIKWTDDAKHMYIDKSGQTNLIPQQQEFDRLEDIKNLGGCEAIWTVMMFDLILKRFWAENFQLEKLSYTSSMIEQKQELLERAEHVNLPIAAEENPVLSLERLAVDDIRAENLTESDIGSEKLNRMGMNDWLEERYMDQVQEDVINLIDDGVSEHYLLSSPQVSSIVKKESCTELVVADSFVTDHKGEIKNLPFWETDKMTSLNAIDGTHFGTEEQINADRKFIARCNAADSIQALARKEYSERIGDIRKWYKEAVESNIENLLPWCGHDNVFAPRNEEKWFEHESHFSGYRSRDNKTPIGRLVDLSEDRAFSQLPLSGVVLHKEDGDCSYHKCYLTGARASYCFVINPEQAEQLAMITNTDICSLPDVLQHWTSSTGYAGNAILNRLDPMQWKLKNPWCGARLTVSIYLSKRALNKIIKEHGGKYEFNIG